MWVFHVGSVENVEPGGGEGAAPAAPQNRPEPPEAGIAHPLSGHTTSAQRPSLGPRSPALLGFVPARRDTQGQRLWLQHGRDGDTRQSHSSYSSGQHGVGVEEDAHFNPDGERWPRQGQ